ncbi:EmrB/QacA subfamily drug resistance transporter [Paenibacillus sp. V4I3]|uniref:MDR family MFS transporter n=1 Tax=unclassified Paenibacillus TaxID=185978 RepID=UPI00277EBBC2|nr:MULTISPECIES: MDR family MFS transporter [unclassified Paenibacillus]MDQ0877185.1 EmrB/QacA subfamily drug resistance transporter [Paenibacillus sp. V4I3]MDQ0886936.1 EmrB/QacA subfamily drug resistance transporter [Paenibacillus sp. V4I9]
MSQPITSGEAEPEFKITSILVPLIAIISGIFMVILDTTAMNVALSKLVVDFKTDLPTIQWTVTGYMLATAAVIPLAGWLSDRFGAKNVFLTSVVLFTVASVLCATPNSAEWLIFFRILQGLGGGFVMPVAMAYVFRLSPPNKIGQVMGMLGVPILLAPAIGPILSGWLVEYHSWHWIFLINLPVGIFSFIFGLWKLPAVARKKVAGFDLPGMILGPIAFASLSYGITQGAESWTSDKTLWGIIIGTVALIAFIIVELKSKLPLLELRVFRSVDFSFSIFVQWVLQFCLFGAIFLLPQFLQQARGYGAFDTGMTLFPQALASAIMMPIGGYLFDKIGVRWLVVVGLSLVSGAIFQYSHVDLTTEGHDLILPLIMAGSGMGLMMMPLNSHLIKKAPHDLVSRVTSLTSAMQQVINSFAVATLVTILSSRVNSSIVAKNILINSPADKQKAMLAVAPEAFGQTFHVMLIIAICGIFLGLFLRRDKTQPNEAVKQEVVLEGLH